MQVVQSQVGIATFLDHRQLVAELKRSGPRVAILKNGFDETDQGVLLRAAERHSKTQAIDTLNPVSKVGIFSAMLLKRLDLDPSAAQTASRLKASIECAVQGLVAVTGGTRVRLRARFDDQTGTQHPHVDVQDLDNLSGESLRAILSFGAGTMVYPEHCVARTLLRLYMHAYHLCGARDDEIHILRRGMNADEHDLFHDLRPLWESWKVTPPIVTTNQPQQVPFGDSLFMYLGTSRGAIHRAPYGVELGNNMANSPHRLLVMADIY